MKLSLTPSSIMPLIPMKDRLSRLSALVVDDEDGWCCNSCGQWVFTYIDCPNGCGVHCTPECECVCFDNADYDECWEHCVMAVSTKTRTHFPKTVDPEFTVEIAGVVYHFEGKHILKLALC
jgi:hypothetical protein